MTKDKIQDLAVQWYASKAPTKTAIIVLAAEGKKVKDGNVECSAINFVAGNGELLENAFISLMQNYPALYDILSNAVNVYRLTQSKGGAN